MALHATLILWTRVGMWRFANFTVHRSIRSERTWFSQVSEGQNSIASNDFSMRVADHDHLCSPACKGGRGIEETDGSNFCSVLIDSTIDYPGMRLLRVG